MKLIVKKNIIIEALKNVNNIISSNNINPILSSVLLETGDNKLIITATNGNNSYLQTISDVKIQKTGEILVRAKFLYNIISKIEQTDIEIHQIDENILQVKTSNFSCEINLIEQRSFPIIEFNYDNWIKLTLTSDVIANVVTKIAPFCQLNNHYDILSGILFKAIDDKNMECLATERKIASYYRFNYILDSNSNSNNDDIQFVVGPDAIKNVFEILASRKIKEFELFTNNKNCIFKIQDTLLSFNLYENNYPYSNIVDTLLAKQKYSFSIKTHDLLLALQRGCLFVSSESRPIVNFHINDKTLDIKFNSLEIGNSFEQIPFENKNISFINFQLNPKLLIQIVSSINMPIITFNCDGENKPIIITTENKYFLNLIMPIHSF